MGVGHHKSHRSTVSVKRWGHVRRWHIILPPKKGDVDTPVYQYYCVSSARLPHYQVASKHCGEYLSSLVSYLGGTTTGRVVVYGPDSDVVETDFMIVVNAFGGYPLIQEMASEFQHTKITELVNRYHEKDDTRGNRFFDRGYAGWQNRKRDAECAGLVLPSKRSVVDQHGNPLSEQDDKYCSSIESLLYRAMKEALPTGYAPCKEDLYMVPPSNGVVIRQRDGAPHQCRYALASESLELVVGCHIDSQNPSPRGDLPSSKMNCLVGCMSVFGGGTRCSLIAYGRESVVVSAVNIELYRPLLDDAGSYFDLLPPTRKDVTCEVVRKFREIANGEADGVARIDIHTNKMVYFSPYVDTISRLTRIYDLDVYDRVCLLYCCVLSEKPDPFLAMCGEIEEEGDWFTAAGDFHTQFSHFYYRMFDKKCAHTGGAARHQPSANVRANQAQLKRTGDILVEAHHSAFSIPVHERSEPRNFSIAVSVLSASAGVHHAGHLLSQHLLVIGACVGVFPQEFLEHGHVCDDNDKIISRLEEGYSIYSKGGRIGRNVQEVGYDVLAALAHHLDSTAFVAENTLCEFLKGAGTPTTCVARKDSFFRAQVGLYRCSILRNPRRPVLQLVTDDTVAVASFPGVCYHNHKAWLEGVQDNTSFFTARRAKKSGSFDPIRQKRAYRSRRRGKRPDPPPSVDVAAACLPPPFAFTMRDVLKRKTFDGSVVLQRNGLVVRVSRNEVRGIVWYGPTVVFGRDGEKLFGLSPQDEGGSALLLPSGSQFRERRGKRGCLLYNHRLIAMECAAMNYLVRYDPGFFVDMWNKRRNYRGGDDTGDDDDNFVFISSLMRNNLFSGRGQGHQQKEPAYVLTEYDGRYLCLYACDGCGRLETNRFIGLQNRIVFIKLEKVDRSQPKVEGRSLCF